MIRVVYPAPNSAVPALVAAMSTGDLAELTSLGGDAQTLYRSLRQSSQTFCGLDDDNRPVVLGGVIPSEAPYIWMVAARLQEDQKRAFLRVSRTELRGLLEIWPTMQTKVDQRWVKSLRWLEWLGFADTGSFEFMGRTGRVMEIRA